MADEKQEPAVPSLFLDRWVRRCGVQEVIKSLLVDLVAAHPEDILAFIHRWSAKQQHQQKQQQHADVITHFFPARKNSVETQGGGEMCNYREESRSLEWTLENETEWERAEQEDFSNTNTRTERVGEPTIQELQALFRDARESPFEFLIDIESFEKKISRKFSVSLSANSIGVCIGRGNYGFVVPAVPKANAEVGKSVFRAQSGDNGHVASSKRNSLLSTDTCRLLAIKVSRVQASWSLCEANHLSSVTTCRQLLEEKVSALQKKLDAQRRAHAGGVGQQDEEDAVKFQASSSSDDALSMDQLEAHLKTQTSLLHGARLVTSLVGDVMYDAQRDVLLFPLEYYPSSLRDCIRARSRVLPGSVTSGCPFPDLLVNNTDGTVMAMLFTVQEVQHVARSLCHALNFLNTSCGLCHLDVKVDNILLSTPWVSGGPEGATSASPLGGEGQLCDEASFPRVVLGDLGLAQSLGSPIMQLGDFSTMSPEVYWAHANEDANYTAYRTPVFCASSDIWSVGCVLLQMINGMEYGAWGQTDVFDALEENHLSPALRHPEVWPMQMNDFIVRCFERDPRRRMQARDALRHPFLAL